MSRMIQRLSTLSLLSVALGAGFLLGCETGGVGDPCIPEDEYQKGFSGFSVEEVNVESRSFQCTTRVCLVNHFQGRVSCPYGNKESDINRERPIPEDGMEGCFVPDNSSIQIEVPVDPQLTVRRAEDAVYCSCRCDGPDANARYCECPSGYSCTRLVENLDLGAAQLAGSYCIREGTDYERTLSRNACRYSARNGMCPPGHTCTGNEPPEQIGDCGSVTDFGAPE